MYHFSMICKDGDVAVLGVWRAEYPGGESRFGPSEDITTLDDEETRGHRVGTVLPNGPEAATSFLAIACAATAAPLNPAYRHDEFHFYLDDLKPKAVVVQEGFDTPARAVAAELGIPVIELRPATEGPAGLFGLGTEAAKPGAFRR